jgi:hypothetical protein
MRRARQAPSSPCPRLVRTSRQLHQRRGTMLFMVRAASRSFDKGAPHPQGLRHRRLQTWECKAYEGRRLYLPTGSNSAIRFPYKDCRPCSMAVWNRFPRIDWLIHPRSMEATSMVATWLFRFVPADVWVAMGSSVRFNSPGH